MPRLTSLSHGAGCACKLSLDELTSILGGLEWPGHPDLLVGLASGDDAAVYRQADGRALVATTDFFTPLVDDPRHWGRIAATNAVSDVYAMGATPRLALNILGWPRDLPFDVLREVLAGAGEVAASAGYVIAGGHSIDSSEPIFGQVVIGDVDLTDLTTNAGARPGDDLLLTKPIGTGIVTTALKRSDPSATAPGGSLADAYAAALAAMTQLNRAAADVARHVGAHAATDVTGFGLLGHLHRMAAASGVRADLDPEAVPLLPGVRDLLAAGMVPGGSQRNAQQADRYLVGPRPDEDTLLLLADAQTSGGLLIACDPAGTSEALDLLRAAGCTDAARIGRIGAAADATPGSVAVATDAAR
jgi:selenide,water dikinase